MHLKITKKLVNKIHSLLDKGVTSGLSKNLKPGDMCLEQAVCYALGEDVIRYNPSCVGKEVRGFTIYLNDANWSSDSTRAEGMRGLAIAQLGSNSLNQKEFREKLSFAVLTKLLPSMFRDLGEEKWEKEIKSLEGANNLKEAKKTVSKAAYVDAHVVSSATLYASHAVNTASYDSSAYTARYAAKATNTGDKYLKMAAYLAVEVLKDMKSPGCQFL